MHLSENVFAQTGNKTVEIDSVAKTITVIKRKSRGTGQGWGGFGPKWTKEVKKVYNFDYKRQSKSVLVQKHIGCTVTPIKSTLIQYENGKKISTGVKHGNKNRIVKEKKKK